MAKKVIKIDYLLGISKKGAYDSHNNVAVKQFEQSLQKILGKFEKDIVKSDLRGLEQQVVDNLSTDILKFMGQMITYFMRQQYSVLGNDRTITMEDDSFDIRGDGSSRLPGWKSEINKNATVAADQLIWPGLAKSTIARKTRAYAIRTIRKAENSKAPESSLYYFHWTGTLANQIRGAISEMLFGYGNVIDPTVQFTTTNAPGPFQRGENLGSIKVRLFRNPQYARVFQPALASGDYSHATNDQSLLNKFLDAKVAEKLGPSRRALTDNKRPWVGPSIAYWIIARVPYVIEQSIRKTIEQNKVNRRAALAKNS
jgi:hypothetical protein